MNFFKMEGLRLLRSRLFSLSLTISILIFSSIYLFVLNAPARGVISIKEIYRVVPTLLTIIVPLFTQGIWYGEVEAVHIGIIRESRVGVEKLLRSKVLFYWFMSSIYSLIILPLVLCIGRYGEVVISEVIVIHIGLIVFSFFITTLGLFYSTVLRGRFLIYLVTVLSLTFLLSGDSYNLFISDSLSRFYNGYIKISDLALYFLSGTLFYTLSLIKIDKQYRKTLLFLIFIPLIIIPGGLDLSRGDRNSLTDLTRELLDGTRVPVSIDYYGTNEIKEITTLLYEYGRNPKINFRKVIGDNSELDKAISRFDPIEIGDKSYSFIVIEYLTRYSVIPIASVGERLEFDIYRELNFLINGDMDSVAILLGDSNFREDDFSYLSRSIEEEFQVEFINRGDSIPTFFNTLIAIGHRDLGFKELSIIGDYLSSGGSIIILANGVDTFGNLEPMDTPFIYALKEAGIFIDPSLIGDNRNLGILSEDGRVEPFPLNIISQNSNSIYNSPLAYPGIDVLGIYTSPIRFNSESSVNLLETSNDAWIVDGESGLYSNNRRISSMAVYDKLLLAPYLGGNGSGKTTTMVIGSTRSFTNMAAELGNYSPYEFMNRAIYMVQDRVGELELRQSISFNYKFDNDPGVLIYIVMLIYPGVILLILYSLRRRVS